jgi:hypothetical protein
MMRTDQCLFILVQAQLWPMLLNRWWLFLVVSSILTKFQVNLSPQGVISIVVDTGYVDPCSVPANDGSYKAKVSIDEWHEHLERSCVYTSVEMPSELAVNH